MLNPLVLIASLLLMLAASCLAFGPLVTTIFYPWVKGTWGRIKRLLQGKSNHATRTGHGNEASCTHDKPFDGAHDKPCE